MAQNTAYYRKWRPQQWDEVVGQEHVITTLRNAVRAGRVAHAYLFAGPRGTGKTTTARLLAKAVNCTHADAAARPCGQCECCASVNANRFMDLIEIDAASNTSVEDVRELREKIAFAPSMGQYKVYIIDEVHMLSTAAFNALLKTLEEPPPHAIFILATTEIHKIPATVLSRCQRYEFRRIPVMEIVSRLKTMAEREGLSVDVDALTLIARQATGSLRDAESLLDQLASTGGAVTLARAQETLGTAASENVVQLVNALLEQNAAAGLSMIHAALDRGSDPRQFARQLVEYLRGLLLIRLGNAEQVETTQEMRAVMAKQAAAFDTARLLEAVQVFNAAAADQRSTWQPGLALELALAQALEEKQAAEPLAEPARATARRQPEPQPVERQPDHQPGHLAQTAATRRSEPAEEQKATREEPKANLESAAGQTSTPQPAGKPGALSLNSLQQNWTKIRAVVKKRKMQVEALLNSCQLVGIKDNVLLLGFTTDVLKQKMESNDNLAIVREGIQAVMGVDIQVACVIAGSKSGGGKSADVDVESDGMVGTALRDLGGEVVDIK
jgi:DNA polymerase-3 subunit gamma/tau